MFRMGIDLGGTKIEGVVLDAENNEIFRDRIATEQEYGYEHILGNIKMLYDVMLAQVANQEHTFGIGTPGAISPNTGMLRNSNTLCLNNRPFREDLQKILGGTINIENDANCFAMAEATGGAGRDKNLVFGVIMGTGCGGGIIYKGQVLTGMHGIGGEWGHATIDPNGPDCYCGKKGCIETLISGGGLENLYEKQFGNRVALADIVERYRSADGVAQEFMQGFFENFGRAMSNLINIVDPDVIVIGGGVSNIPELYGEGIKYVEKYVFSDFFKTPIVKNELGDSAGVLGAAFIGC